MAEDQQAAGLMAPESIKVIGESVGVSGLSDEAVSRINDDVVYRLREIVQEAAKFARHSKRTKLLPSDIDCALRVKNIEPIYGFDSAECLPFRHTSGGGKEIFYLDDKEVDLLEYVSTPLPQLPLEPSLRSHWLAVSGVQPVIPENPPQLTVDEQRQEGASSLLPSDIQRVGNEELSDESELNKLKPLQSHSLSLEQQLYFTEITEACIGLSDQKRVEALTSLSSDPGLYQLIPYLSNFITEGIRVNVAQKKLSNLKYLVKMAKALLDNTTVSLEKCLHELTPALTSCIIARQVCLKPEVEDHWYLKEMAAKMMSSICKKFNSTSNNLQARYTRVLSRVLNDPSSNITMHYGAVMGLSELGQETITALVLPKLQSEAKIIQGIQQSAPSNSIDHIGASKLQILLVRVCAPVLMNIRPLSDNVQSFQVDYGFLGNSLYNHVQTLRKAKTSSATTLSQLRTGLKTVGNMLSQSPLSSSQPPPLQLGGATRSTTLPRMQSPVSTPNSVTQAALFAVLGYQQSVQKASGIHTPPPLQSPTLTSPTVPAPSSSQPSTPSNT